MTVPRQVLPGAIYLVTRRCAQRQFLLRPSALTNGIFRYVLALAAQRFGVLIHAYCVLSNHFHLVLTDPDARLPAFEQYLDSLVARAVNASLGRWEAFWAPSSYSAVRLASPADVIDKIVYVLTNPVAAGLVRRGRDWPGVWSAPEQIGAGPAEVSRPASFFRESMPQAVPLELSLPPGFGPELRDRVAEALAQREDESAAALEASGRRFLGAKRVLGQNPWARPASREPRRNLNPRIAARDKWKRIEVLGRLADFVRAYRKAWGELRAGLRDVIFPAGTYWLRVTQGVRCVAYG